MRAQRLPEPSAEFTPSRDSGIQPVGQRHNLYLDLYLSVDTDISPYFSESLALFHITLEYALRTQGKQSEGVV